MREDRVYGIRDNRSGLIVDKVFLWLKKDELASRSRISAVISELDTS